MCAKGMCTMCTGPFSEVGDAGYIFEGSSAALLKQHWISAICCLHGA